HIDLVADLSTSDIVRRVRRFELDAGLIYSDQTLTAGLDVVQLYLERHVLLVPAGFLPETQTSLSWADAAKLPLCLLEGSMHGRRIVDEALADLGIVAEPQVETDSIATLGALVDSGRWAGIIPRPWAQLWARPPATRLVELVDPVVRSEVGLVTNPGAPGSMVARAFVDCARGLASVGLGCAAEREPNEPEAWV
ncbi:MAG: LysR family transcriptional regulator substrate-binding protein, partial [Acidimicrobiaceae bacterium]|nr:LysR family transcriptional regulator substrate-binding protein [Acidimicrobiaceae bacterium]